jgi:hypothetical protein
MQPLIETLQGEAREKFTTMWDAGEFEWNHHTGDTLGKKPTSLERVFNTFIVALISNTVRRAYGEGANRERERILRLLSEKGKSIAWDTDHANYICEQSIQALVRKINEALTTPTETLQKCDGTGTLPPNPQP